MNTKQKIIIATLYSVPPIAVFVIECNSDHGVFFRSVALSITAAIMMFFALVLAALLEDGDRKQ